VVLKSGKDNFIQVITSVYGPNRRALKPDLWQEILFPNIDGTYRGLLEGILILPDTSMS